MEERLPLVTIMGPTGVGKTNLAITLSELIVSQVISVDSVQVYRNMNIGSGKPSEKILKKHPHKLVNIIDPWETYSAALFVLDSSKEIVSCKKLNQIPILVGGTMLYFNSLVKGLSKMPKSNQKIRKKISNEAEKKGWPFLHKRLIKVDPQSASRIHSNDSKRIQRALEVYQLSGRTITELHKNTEENFLKKSNKILQFAIKPDSKNLLREKIKKRFLCMLDNGLKEEVEMLLDLNQMDTNMNSMKSIGYRQVCEHLEGKISYQEMVSKAVNATRQLAKHQMTWLKGWEKLNWLTSNKEDSLHEILKRIGS